MPKNAAAVGSIGADDLQIANWTLIRAEPIQGCLAIDEPLRGEHRGSFSLFRASLRKSGRHLEGEFANPCSPVARNDVSVAPLHHSIAEAVAEIRSIDEQPPGSGFLCFAHEKAKRCHEAAVRHICRGRQPLQLEQIKALVLENDSPFVACKLFRHRSSWAGLGDTVPSRAGGYSGTKYIKSIGHFLGTWYIRIPGWMIRTQSNAWKESCTSSPASGGPGSL